MSIANVQDGILEFFRSNEALDAEFSSELTGTVSTSGTSVVGDGTAFASQVKVGDYIGTPLYGYRKIASISSDAELELSNAFDNNISNVAIKKSDIGKGMGGMVNLSEVGKYLKLSFVSSADMETIASSNRVMGVYGFLVMVGFHEADPELAEETKSRYDKMIRNAIEGDFTFGGVCIGTTKIGTTQVAENFDIEGDYYVVLSLVCYRYETRGNR